MSQVKNMRFCRQIQQYFKTGGWGLGRGDPILAMPGFQKLIVHAIFPRGGKILTILEIVRIWGMGSFKLFCTFLTGMNLKHKFNDAMPYWGEKRGHFAQIVYVFCVRGGAKLKEGGCFPLCVATGPWPIF